MPRPLHRMSSLYATGNYSDYSGEEREGKRPGQVALKGTHVAVNIQKVVLCLCGGAAGGGGGHV